MLFSENWLREWVDPDVSVAELADRLTMAGLEVDSVNEVRAEFSGVVVGEIQEITAHPDSDKLSLCKVEHGHSNSVDVVCGASNIAVGMKIPLAMIGAKLPNGMTIEPTTIRGSASAGMICSEAELGLTEKSEGIMQLDAQAKTGESVACHLALKDNVIELELTPNRGDCLSIAGIAREVAALTGATVRPPEIKAIKASSKREVSIQIQDYRGCPRYVGRVIENINAAAVTPDWLKEKLRRCGVRPISAVVDITNYVMLELGQPMHAFDLDNIDTGVIVRHANEKEQLTLLDDSVLTLKSDDLLICDHRGPIALAGIMGGLGSGINDQTQSVLLESAYFSPSQLIGKARRIGMQTDASYRFERGVDPTGQERAVQRATALILDICGGEAGDIIGDSNDNNIPVKSSIKLRYQRLDTVLGVSIKPANISRYLMQLGCRVEQQDNAAIVVPPAYRFDLDKEHDLIEEVARLYGYDKLPETIPRVAVTSKSGSESVIPISRFRTLMIDKGYHEAITYSFVDPTLQATFRSAEEAVKKTIHLKNPIADNLSEMRTSLAPGLLTALAYNYHRQHRQIQLFEIGNIYYSEAKQRVERTILAGISTGMQRAQQWGATPVALDYFDLKSDVEAIIQLVKSSQAVTYRATGLPGFHPGRSAGLYSGGNLRGFIGQVLPSVAEALGIDQDVYYFELDVGDLSQSSITQYQSTSKFPSIRRDLSLIIDNDISSARLLEEIGSCAGENLVDLKLFDVYTGKPIDSNKKSISIGLTFQALNRTLTEQEMDEACSRVLEHLHRKLNAQLRI